MSRKLKDLTPKMRAAAIELIARCVEDGIMICIVDTLRTQAEQAANVAAGVSWTMNSRHLLGEAIDIAPYDQYQLHGPDKLKWDSNDPVWDKIGSIGESVGLKWGVWRKGVNIDKGHFELPH